MIINSLKSDSFRNSGLLLQTVSILALVLPKIYLVSLYLLHAPYVLPGLVLVEAVIFLIYHKVSYDCLRSVMSWKQKSKPNSCFQLAFGHVRLWRMNNVVSLVTPAFLHRSDDEEGFDKGNNEKVSSSASVLLGRLLGPDSTNAGHAACLHLLCSAPYLAAGAAMRLAFYADYDGVSPRRLGEAAAWCLAAAPAVHLVATVAHYRLGHPSRAAIAAGGRARNLGDNVGKLARRIIGKD